MIFVFLSSRIKNTSVFVLIDSTGRTGVVLLCCEISIRRSEEKGIEGKLSQKLSECLESCKIEFPFWQRITTVIMMR